MLARGIRQPQISHEVQRPSAKARAALRTTLTQELSPPGDGPSPNGRIKYAPRIADAESTTARGGGRTNEKTSPANRYHVSTRHRTPHHTPPAGPPVLSSADTLSWTSCGLLSHYDMVIRAGAQVGRARAILVPMDLTGSSQLGILVRGWAVGQNQGRGSFREFQLDALEPAIRRRAPDSQFLANAVTRSGRSIFYDPPFITGVFFGRQNAIFG